MAQPEYRPTVCLNSMTGKVRGMLLYQGAESYEDICVTKKMTRIGYGPDADIQIQADTISQLHARIDHDGETYYIEDLNSTNGTFVNDEPLAYKERRKLNSNDMIRFADVRYRFSLTALSFQMEVSILIACKNHQEGKVCHKKMKLPICNRGICRCECSCLCDSGNPWKYRKFGVYGKNGGGLAAICEAGRILETVYSYFYAFWI